MESKLDAPPRPVRILRLREVEQRTGLSRPTIYRLASKDFPKPIRLGNNSSGWLESEIDAWLAARIAARDAQAGAA